VRLLVVIVNYRVPHLVIDCLRSLADEIKSIPGAAVAVCENGSADRSAEIIRKAIDDNDWRNWCSFVVSSNNLGFTGGNNILMRPALESNDPPDYVLLLNPDTIILPHALTELLDFMEKNPTVGIAGSRLEDPDGTPQRSAFRFQSPLGEFEATAKFGPATRLLKRWIVAPAVVERAVKTDWVSGASMMVRRKVFEETGLLDEDYFTYFDDIDFCFNARKNGWQTWYVPTSRVVHLIGQSTGVNAVPRRLPSYLLEARRRYFLKNHGPVYATLVDACAILGLMLSQLRRLVTEHENKTPPHLLWDSIRHSVFFNGFKIPSVKPPRRF
jgi:N-acetylglucosaminyl-diphospho-decaprenol L-rhamnosyltransferase